MSENKIGSKGRAEKVVNSTNTAETMGSGTLAVFATPALVAMMEEAAVNAVKLDESQTSVGISLDIKHIAATPVGMKVWAEAELIEVDKRRLVFKVEAFDEKEMIGSGIHERFIVDSAKFMAKAEAKKSNGE